MPLKIIDVLISEYQAGNAGYDNRDSIVNIEFAGMITMISALILIINYFSNKDGIFLFIIGYVAFLSLFSLNVGSYVHL